MKKINKLIVILLSAFFLSGCITIICNSKVQDEREVFTDKAVKNQAEKINNEGGLF